MTGTNNADPQDDGQMLAAVRGLPDQIDDTWAGRAALDLPWADRSFEHIVVLGMGGSAIGGDLAANLFADQLPVPVIVVRDDHVPRWVSPRTLVIGISVSGTTAETMAAWSEALGRGCAAVAITRGGAMAERAREAGAPIIRLPDGGPPRTALGRTFTWCAAVFEHLGLVAGAGGMLAEATAAMRTLVAGDPTPTEMADRLTGVVPIVYVPAALEAVGRRWKAQLNENAKVAAAYDCTPELHHNSVVGYAAHRRGEPPPPVHPILLQTAGREAATMALTARLLDDLGLPYSSVQAPPGMSGLAQGLWLVQFGDLVSVRLAYRRGVDPTPIAVIERIKALRASGHG